MRLDILGMQAFVSIAEYKNFRQAAEHLNISQTALSHRLQKFEHSIGVKLIARTTRRVTLTNAGFTFLPGARQAINECFVSVREMRALGIDREEFISFGCLPALSSRILPTAIRNFASRSPEVTVRLFDRTAPEIVNGVLSQELEFGIAFGTDADPQIIVQPLAKVRYVVVCSRSSPLARMPSVRPEDLSQVPLIRLGQHDIGHVLLEERLSTSKVRLRWDYQVQHAFTAIRLAAAGLGAALLPEFAVDPQHDADVTAVGFDHPRTTINLGIISLKDRLLSASAHCMIACIQEAFRDL